MPARTLWCSPPRRKSPTVAQRWPPTGRSCREGPLRKGSPEISQSFLIQPTGRSSRLSMYPRQSRKGISEIEGKVARVATSERGTRSDVQTAAPYRATTKAFHDLRLDSRMRVCLLSYRRKIGCRIDT